MIKGRFAPSPTGRMHMGNVCAALLSWLSAKGRGGQWLLRIEDIDPQRSKQEYADQLQRDLEWLGLTWDEGPYYQSQRSEIYEGYLNVLKEKGLIYPSYKTRAERLAVSAPQAGDAGISGISGKTGQSGQSGQSGKPALAMRVSDTEISYLDGHYGLQTANMKTNIGDFVVRRRDGAWAYQLCVVIDDALMGVTEVVRGRDLLQSACQQIYLYNLLGFKAPAFIHHPLLINAAGQRLSKRDKSLDLGELSKKYTPEELIGQIAYYVGITESPEPVKSEDLLPLFSWDKVPTYDCTITY